MICDGSGTSQVCSTEALHQHCVCGLPMRADRAICPLCELEQLCPDEDRPSRRLSRTPAAHPSCYLDLFRCVAGEQTQRVLGNMDHGRRWRTHGAHGRFQKKVVA